MARPPRTMVGDDSWWETHWHQAPAEIIAFFAEDGIELAGSSVADFGSGDGIMAAGLARLCESTVVGFDLDPTDSLTLQREAEARGVDIASLRLEFRKATAGSIDADDAEFDVGVSWSVLEHVFDREGYMREARRVIKPHGHLFVQVWPLWYSEHGHHLFQWLGPFDHLRYGRDDIVARLRSLEQTPRRAEAAEEHPLLLSEFLLDSQMDPEEWLSVALASYDSCNRITLDDIQALLLEHGFGVGRVEVLTAPFHVPIDLQSLPLSRLAINGFKLIAWRKP
jgi:SAM-dependent methyltransferase